MVKGDENVVVWNMPNRGILCRFNRFKHGYGCVGRYLARITTVWWLLSLSDVLLQNRATSQIPDVVQQHEMPAL